MLVRLYTIQALLRQLDLAHLILIFHLFKSPDLVVFRCLPAYVDKIILLFKRHRARSQSYTPRVELVKVLLSFIYKFLIRGSISLGCLLRLLLIRRKTDLVAAGGVLEHKGGMIQIIFEFLTFFRWVILIGLLLIHLLIISPKSKGILHLIWISFW